METLKLKKCQNSGNSTKKSRILIVKRLTGCTHSKAEKVIEKLDQRSQPTPKKPTLITKRKRTLVAA